METSTRSVAAAQLAPGNTFVDGVTVVDFYSDESGTWIATDDGQEYTYALGDTSRFRIYAD